MYIERLTMTTLVPFDFFKLPLIQDKRTSSMNPTCLTFIQEHFDTTQELAFEQVIGLMAIQSDHEIKTHAEMYRSSMDILLALHQEPTPRNNYRIGAQGLLRYFTSQDIPNLENLKQDLIEEVKQGFQGPLFRLEAWQPMKNEELAHFEMFNQFAQQISQQMKQNRPDFKDVPDPTPSLDHYKKWPIDSLNQLPNDCYCKIYTYFNQEGTLVHKDQANQTFEQELANIDYQLKKPIIPERNYTDPTGFFDVWNPVLNPGPEEFIVRLKRPIPQSMTTYLTNTTTI